MIYLVRHGEAAAGWGSHPDPGLSSQGQGQAEAVSKALSKRPIEHIVSSPMLRCRETACPFERTSGLKAILSQAVSEIPTPPDIGDRVSWLKALMAGEWKQAETLIQVWREALLDFVFHQPPETVIFTHFVAINAITAAVEDSPNVLVFRPDYCSVTTLETKPNGVRVLTRGQSQETRIL